MYKKRGQGLSLRVIIVAAMVLIVLIVVWSIFTGRIGGFSKELVECRGQPKVRSECTYEKGGVIDTQVPAKTVTTTAPGVQSLSMTSSNDIVCCVPLT